ncbi:MAG: FAD-binding oxidoreductase [Bacteroidetes bacterium]|nr:FAD-binding oxidoreductase [Bacteroidota bacterium]
MENVSSLSFWERQTYFEGVDLLIVGSGIVGLNAARAARHLKPNWKILVVDRGAILPYGASTRNAGFACFGSMTELLDDLKNNAENDVFDLVQRRWTGLQRLRNVIGDKNLGYEELGGYELFSAADKLVWKECLNRLDGFNQQLESICGKKNNYEVATHEIENFGFSGVNHLIKNKGEGQVDTGKMMKSLLSLVREKNVDVLNGIDIKAWQQNESALLVDTGNGFKIPTQQLLITTNAFAKQLLPDILVEPGRAQVLITKPISELKVKGTFHIEKGYYYFRNVGDRLLLGGGRNLDFKSENTYEFGTTSKVQDHLENLLSTIILPKHTFEIDQRWSGIMGLGPVKSSIIQKVEERIYCAVRMGGMGVAIGTQVGEEAAALVCN